MAKNLSRGIEHYHNCNIINDRTFCAIISLTGINTNANSLPILSITIILIAITIGHFGLLSIIGINSSQRIYL